METDPGNREEDKTFTFPVNCLRVFAGIAVLKRQKQLRKRHVHIWVANSGRLVLSGLLTAILAVMGCNPGRCLVAAHNCQYGSYGLQPDTSQGCAPGG